MNEVSWNKVQENDCKDSLYSHSANNLSIDKIDEVIKPEMAAEILRKHGVDISLEQATQILNLLRKFAHIVVSRHLESQNQNVMRRAD